MLSNNVLASIYRWLDYNTLTRSVPYVNRMSYAVYMKDVNILNLIDKHFIDELNCIHLRELLGSTITIFFRNVRTNVLLMYLLMYLLIVLIRYGKRLYLLKCGYVK